MTKTPLVSVIIPVYNVEKYLSKCLDSVINQTLKNIEIICINDGSKDKSLEILEKYKNQDTRIKIINHENNGVAAARNTGYKVAQGEYICFIDSDDWIDATLLEKTYNTIIQDESDIVLFDVINVYNDSYIPVCRAKNFIKKYKKHLFYFNEIKDIIYHTPTAWSKLYKKSFLDKNLLSFPKELRLGEDSPYWLEILFANPKISVLDECLYYYVKRDSGLSGNFDYHLLDKQWNVYEYIKSSKKYQYYDEEYKLLILDFNTRLAVYGYSAMSSLKLFIPYEKSLINFTKEYNTFKKFNLFKLRGYKLLKFRWFYSIGKKVILNYLKVHMKGVSK